MHRILLLLSVALLALVACDQAPASAPDETEPETLATVETRADRGETPLVVFKRGGDEPGDVLEWRIYASGRGAAITGPDAGNAQLTEVDVDQAAITQLLDDLQTAGFFEIASAGEEECCNQNSYVLTVQQDGEVSAMALEAVTPQTSRQRLQSLTHIEKFIFDEITSAAQ
ncbi:MAG TPA: hypothetical protein VK879_02525 [Candidatus Sulfomarinibacteraceae bacterium]|nr:hypothetical protein [Candidatus Sulfomarinibacteraceae bacterium]